jgi:hypothetical protein
MRRLLGYLICGAAVILPHRARVLLVEALGWLWQGARFLFKALFEIMVRELAKSDRRAG